MTIAVPHRGRTADEDVTVPPTMWIFPCLYKIITMNMEITLNVWKVLTCSKTIRQLLHVTPEILNTRLIA